MRGIDIAALQDIMGEDGRMWVSYGTILLDEEVEEDGEKALVFDEKWGPLVEVRLHPSDFVVTCRVAGDLAGSLEGSWEPMVGGDEVVVVIPEGEARAIPVIIGRLNNGLDLFPTKVAGKETNLNNLSFRRMRSPHVTETASSYLIRSAVTGAMMGIDELGNITLRDGNKAAMQFGASGFALQDADGTGQLVLNSEEGYVSMWWENTIIKANGTDININASGNILMSSSGNPPGLRAVGIEQVVNLMISYLHTLALAGAAPITGNMIDPAGAGATVIAGAIAMASSNSAPSLSVNLGLVNSAMGAPMGITALTPGLACPGLLIG